MYSGGGLFHTGSLDITNTSFIDNQAGQDGLAMYSFGALIEAPSLTFSNNTLYCPEGKYGYAKKADEVSSARIVNVCGLLLDEVHLFCRLSILEPFMSHLTRDATVQLKLTVPRHVTSQ